MKELWKDIPGYEGYYQASNLGRIRSLDNECWNGSVHWIRPGRILRSNLDDKGYYRVKLYYVKHLHAAVHRLVAATWFRKRLDGEEVRHGANGNRDNSISNLSYGTRSDNQLDRRRDGMSYAKPVKRSDGKIFVSLCQAAEETYLANRRSISRVCLGITNEHAGFKWEYINE